MVCVQLARVLAISIGLTATAGATPTTSDVVLPPGTRTIDGQVVSSRGLRDTTDFIAKELATAKIAVRQVGPYRVRGVELTRFVSQTATTRWLAIHVLRTTTTTAGKTLIFFVARPAS